MSVNCAWFQCLSPIVLAYILCEVMRWTVRTWHSMSSTLLSVLVTPNCPNIRDLRWFVHEWNCNSIFGGTDSLPVHNINETIGADGTRRSHIWPIQLFWIVGKAGWHQVQHVYDTLFPTWNASDFRVAFRSYLRLSPQTDGWTPAALFVHFCTIYSQNQCCNTERDDGDCDCRDVMDKDQCDRWYKWGWSSQKWSGGRSQDKKVRRVKDFQH